MKAQRRILGIWARVLVLILSLFVLQGLSQSTGDAGTQNVINELGGSAKAFGLGRAYVAIADDPAAVFWNPAGLEYIPRMSLSLFHSSLIAGAAYDFIGFVYPTLQFGTVGLGYARVGSGSDIPVVNEFNIQQGTASYDVSELYISYAKQLPYSVTGGLTFKFHRQQFSFNNAVSSGIGLDAGIMVHPPWEAALFQDLTIGVRIQNLVKPQLKLGSVSEELPQEVRLGVAKSFPVGLAGRFTFSLDYSKPELGPTRIHAGSEYQVRNLGTIRLGYDQSNLAFGAGIKYRFMEIDYAYGNLSYQGDFSPSHRFSIKFNLSKTRQELIQLAEAERKRRERELVERTKAEEKARRIKEHLERGQQYLQEKRLFDAYAEFQQVIVEDPFHKVAKTMLDSTNRLIQRSLEERQQQAIAQAVDKELARENQRLVQLHFEKGQVYLQKNQFTDALKEFILALERAPNDPIIQEAIRTTRRRLAEQVHTLVVNARNSFRKGNYADALQILSEALVLAPDDPKLKEEVTTLANRIKVQQYVQQALQLYDLGEYERALSLFEEALALDPSNQAIRNYLARARKGLGAGKEEMDPESERQYIVGTELYLKGRYQEALEIWKKLAEKYPFNKKVQDAIKNAEDRLRRTQQR